MRVDLHIHTSYSPDAVSNPSDIVQRCLETGLHCIAITDHNTMQGALEVKRLAPFPVILGEEIKSAAGDIIGLFLQEEIPEGLSLVETVQAIKYQGGLVCAPHPLDRFRGSALGRKAFEELLPDLDIIEGFNAHTILGWYDTSALNVAKRFNIAVTAVSDSHVTSEIGETYVETEDFEVTPERLKFALLNAIMVTRRPNPLLRLIPFFARVKRLFH